MDGNSLEPAMAMPAEASLKLGRQRQVAVVMGAALIIWGVVLTPIANSP